MYDATEITKLFVFGTNSPSSTDYNEHIRPIGDPPASIPYSMSGYMTSGGGRFAYPSLFGAVEKFFSATIPDGIYTYAEIASPILLGLAPADLEVGISQYGTAIGSPDHAERSYIFGSTSFKLDTSMTTFEVIGGVKTIKNMEVRAFNDNFDFKAGNPFAQFVGSVTLEPKVDPYELSRGPVDIRFDGPGKTHISYSQQDFATDEGREGDVSVVGRLDRYVKDALGVASLPVNGGLAYLDRITSDPFLSYSSGPFKVIYGTPGNDDLSIWDAGALQGVDSGDRLLIVGGAGNDTLTGIQSSNKLDGGDGNDTLYSNSFSGDELNGGNGNDIITGGEGDDIITGGNGNDIMNGGNGNDIFTGDEGDDIITGGNGNDIMNGGFGDDIMNGGFGDDIITGGEGNNIINGGESFLFGLFEGTDTSVYKGPFANYDIEFLTDGSVQIGDNLGNASFDTLEGIDIARFSDKSVDLTPGQDIAFVIDTTGSMYDDIDAVKAGSRDIIDAIFDSDRGFLNSRIAVVGYNDPDTNTFLSFTDHSKIDDRKTAAINAIESISVGGGGDFPEAVNAGLLRALNGDAGQWRKEADSRRIILFGDAPPNDDALRGLVFNLALNVGVSISRNVMPMSIVGDIETSSVASGLAVTRFAVSTVDADDAPVTFPVEIFTILIGNDPTTAADFKSLATATGGKAFNAADASEVVAALIAAIQAPTDGSSNEAPIAQNDTATTQQETAVNVAVLTNDSDSDSDTLAIDSFTQGSNGTVTLNDNGTSGDTTDDFLVYTPDRQSNLTVGFIDSFEYTVSDGNDAMATATVTVAVGKIENGGNGNDSLTGTPGDDVLSGGNGKDVLTGMDGNDVLLGGNGKDILIGGLGNDSLTGGNGDDIFGLTIGDGTDLIADFKKGNDTLGLIGDLTFGSNVSTQILNGETLIWSNGEALARLTGTFTLTGADFMSLV